MNKLIITDGPTASGKTWFAQNWVEGSLRRSVAWNILSAERLLSEGHDVVLDAEQPERDAAIKHFAGRPDTEVRYFKVDAL